MLRALRCNAEKLSRPQTGTTKGSRDCHRTPVLLRILAHFLFLGCTSYSQLSEPPSNVSVPGYRVMNTVEGANIGTHFGKGLH